MVHKTGSDYFWPGDQRNIHEKVAAFDQDVGFLTRGR